METTPSPQISTPNRKPFSSPCWTSATPEATFRQIPETEILGTYNAVMDEVSRNIPRKRQPLPSQLVSWEESSPVQPSDSSTSRKRLKTVCSYVM